MGFWDFKNEMKNDSKTKRKILETELKKPEVKKKNQTYIIFHFLFPSFFSLLLKSSQTDVKRFELSNEVSFFGAFSDRK